MGLGGTKPSGAPAGGGSAGFVAVPGRGRCHLALGHRVEALAVGTCLLRGRHTSNSHVSCRTKFLHPREPIHAGISFYIDERSFRGLAFGFERQRRRWPNIPRLLFCLFRFCVTDGAEKRFYPLKRLQKSAAKERMELPSYALFGRNGTGKELRRRCAAP